MPLTSLLVLALSFGLLWLVSLARRDASLADIWWGPAQTAAALAVWPVAPDPRAWIVAGLVAAWGLRLAWHIASRHAGEDPRYRAWRERHGRRWWWLSLLQVFLLQAGIAWVIAWPVATALAAGTPLGAADLAGAGLAAVGLLFETIADRQLQRFRDDPSRRGQVLDRGLWRYSRHPNYFGDATFWWGIGLVGGAASGDWRVLAGPALLTVLLLRVSGVTLLESSLRATRPGYADYVRRTSGFVPWRPRSSGSSGSSSLPR